VVVCVSGGFDPFHVGHLDHFREARNLGDRLMVILTRDDQLIRKKGYCFMPYEERKDILESIVGVDEVVPNVDHDITSNESLEHYRPQRFAKGGDRTQGNMPEAEIIVCQKIGCEIVYGVEGRVRSSSQMLKRVLDMIGVVD